MRLLSVNVSEPRVIAVDGERVETSIFKEPVAGPVKVRRLNLQGDRQADLSVHGGTHKAVYAYPWENVEFWRQTLQRPDLPYGSFGENLTVKGLLETETAIGDELEIGSARFQVTTPRIPCFKLAAAFGLPDFPKRFLKSRRTGFYLRVLREGIITAGDVIQKFAIDGLPRITIWRLAEMRYTHQATPEEIERLLATEALPEAWKSWFARHFPARRV